MKKLNITKQSAVLLLAVSGIYGCGGGTSDPDPTDVVDHRKTTSTQISGTAIKGSMDNATVSVSQINNANITITDNNKTNAAGEASFVVQGDLGFGINSPFRITVMADDTSSMLCDAASCAGLEMGSVISGAPLTGTKLSSLAFASVPYSSAAGGNSGVTFHASALTTVASSFVEQAIVDGANVTVEQLFDLALQNASDLTLRALGVFSPGSNVYNTAVVSGESYQNFVTGEDCQVVNEQEQCTDVLVEPSVIKLSLLNAAFANITEDETFNGLIEQAIAVTNEALAGNAVALNPVRERLFAAVQAVPFLNQLGMSAEDVIDLGLAFVVSDLSTGPVKEITTDEAISSATITGTGRISDNEAEGMVLDGDVNTKWLDNSATPSKDSPRMLNIQFQEAQAVNTVLITSANDAPERDIENFEIWASNDNNNWFKLASFVGLSFDERFERQSFKFNNKLEFLTYSLRISKNRGDQSLTQVAEIEYVGPVYPGTIHTMPADTLTISGRGRISDGEAETMAFDGDPNTKWLDNTAVPTEAEPSWVIVTLPEAVAVDAVALTSANDGPERDPENFNLEGSNDDGVTWIRLDDWIGESFDERFERKVFASQNALTFSSYRFNITKNKGDSNLMQIAEIELIGPKVPDLKHSHAIGAIYQGRARISDGEAEPMAFDNDVNTKWLDNGGAPSEAEPSWVQVQLPSAATVNKLALVSANDAPSRDPENFELQASHDGLTWIVLNSWIGESFDERFERRQFNFANDLAFSFYRLNITKNKGDDGLMQVAEIELIGPQFSSIDHSSNSGITVTGRARISDGEAETMVFDDNLDTKWLDNGGVPSEEDPAWVQVDLLEPKIVNSIAITSANDASSRDPENFNLVGSNDGGVTWETIDTWVGESFDDRFERQLFEMGNGFAYSTYRFNITKNKGDDSLMQITEIELIGPE